MEDGLFNSLSPTLNPSIEAACAMTVHDAQAFELLLGLEKSTGEPLNVSDELHIISCSSKFNAAKNLVEEELILQVLRTQMERFCSNTFMLKNCLLIS